MTAHHADPWRSRGMSHGAWKVKQEAARLGLRTKQRTFKVGRASSGMAFRYGHIHRIVHNPLYTGHIHHKGVVHEGQQTRSSTRNYGRRRDSESRRSRNDGEFGKRSRSPTRFAGSSLTRDAGSTIVQSSRSRRPRINPPVRPLRFSEISCPPERPIALYVADLTESLGGMYKAIQTGSDSQQVGGVEGELVSAD
jgi:hypothetical protein